MPFYLYMFHFIELAQGRATPGPTWRSGRAASMPAPAPGRREPCTRSRGRNCGNDAVNSAPVGPARRYAGIRATPAESHHRGAHPGSATPVHASRIRNPCPPGRRRFSSGPCRRRAKRTQFVAGGLYQRGPGHLSLRTGTVAAHHAASVLLQIREHPAATDSVDLHPGRHETPMPRILTPMLSRQSMRHGSALFHTR